MAAADASALPSYGKAWRVYFTIYDNDGDPVPTAAALDSEISLDGGTFADCTNEATEIATSSGSYYLDLTAAEMTANAVVIQVKTTTTNAKTTVIIAYPGTPIAISQAQIVKATVDTVVNTHTPTTTEFQADDITEATADHYKGRIVIFTSGALASQATDITGYAAVGGIGQFTVTALTEAPANNDTFIII